MCVPFLVRLSFSASLILGLISSGGFAASPGRAGLNRTLQPFVDKQELAGAVMLVATKDKILDVETVGFADIAAKKPMTADALFWIASQTKPMTATALMMLVDEGKVNLDDAVEKYLPEFKGQMVIVEDDAEHRLLRKPSHPITVRNVLSHMSGLRYRSPIEQPTLDTLRLRDAVGSHAMLPLQWEPDTRYQYSNAGINTAARIVEVVSGLSYEDFMQQRLFSPLGMKNTTFWPSEAQALTIAKAYKPNAEKTALKEFPIDQLTYPLSDRVHRFPMPAGGLFSTARDVARFCQMILSGGTFEGKRYVSEASVKEMARRQTPASVKEAYGLGWALDAKGFGHGGALASSMNIDLQSGTITVWLVQHAGFLGEGAKSRVAFREAAEVWVSGTKKD